VEQSGLWKRAVEQSGLWNPLSRPSACLAPVRTSTKGLSFQLAMAFCNAPRDASAFLATPPVLSTCMPTRAPALYLDTSALALKPSYSAQQNMQRHTSLDLMCVHRLHPPTAPVSRSALALKEPGQCRAGRNHPRGGPQGSLPRTAASAKLIRSHQCQQEACFLPCTRPPDSSLPFRPTCRRSAASGHHTH
jgi:hypothetical protein